MKNKQYAWVIKRDDGKYWHPTVYDGDFTELLYEANVFSSENIAKVTIKNNKIQNCKPVKVEIREVEE